MVVHLVWGRLSILTHSWANETAKVGDVEQQVLLGVYKLDDAAIVPSLARISELRGYC